MRYFARRGARDDADDLATEVFIVAWRRFPPGQEATARAWLFGVARRVLSAARRTQLRRWSLNVPLLEDHDAPSPDQTDALSLSLDIRRLWNGLSRRDQEILALVVWEDLTPADAALVLGISRTAATMRLARARSRLRARLDDPHPAAQSETAGADSSGAIP